MTAALAQTALHAWHVDHGGRMVDFAGWSMPGQYTSITQEHQATRQHATLFDVSHMGRLRLEGRDAARFLDGLLTRRVVDLPPGQIRYSLVTREDGGILDDVLVYRLQPAQGRPFFWMVVNASNREKILAWLTTHQSAGSELTIRDETRETAMIAVQGPRALAIAQRVIAEPPLSALKYYRAAWREDGNDPLLLVSRTGYTGEDGLELVVRQEGACALWEQLMTAGAADGIQPAGLGARDTLRLEAAMPLYGHELSEQITPFQAGLAFAVDLEDRTFPGVEALRRAQTEPLPRRIGLRVENKRVPRQHHRVRLTTGEDVGEVTSGTYSPTFACPLAMAYVRPNCDPPDGALQIDIRGHAEPARIVPLPFYHRRRAAR